ncbi:ComEC/Rec2 family competence protein [Pontibacter silvestris]|uniref:ComEC/Rec2 family competence protein n=1 Tax=Pontibacter silvestris TaxID=2305183 RepID=A0ABW4X467_9BACT|nr:ComEC/Rec2 family competence protein [Pontibacter silvestris]MCC9134881.1 ComEC family competence protein [Pontibacter silvestris]
MLRWAPYPLVRVTLAFIAGILLYISAGREFRYSTELFAFFAVAFMAALFAAQRLKTTFATNIAGIVAVLCFVTAGIWATGYHTEIHHPKHLSKLEQKPEYYLGVVDDYVVQKPGYQSTVLKVLQVQANSNWQSAEGRIQLSVPHDSEQMYELNYGDVLLIKGAPDPVASPANPNQFDYRQYLANKSIHFRHYLQPLQFQKVTSAPPNPILSFGIKLRRKLDNILRERIEGKQQYDISSALVLGIKDDLDNAIRNAYANTGTMHVLAVSGLHVGLIYGLLMLFFSRYIGGKWWQRLSAAIIILGALGLYALMTGLSPSVMRAVVMFSVVTVAKASRRNGNIYNTVACAALVLLCWNPYSLLEVGFQLSFLAVLGIVYLQPRLKELLELDNQLLDKIWELGSIAVAAQLATLPLGLFYFHQFPVYFWFANIIVVPLASFVLYFGIAALAFLWVPLLGDLLFAIHTGLIWCMNKFNLLLTSLPYAIMNGVDINLLQTVLLYVLILLLIFFFAGRRIKYFAMAVCVVAVLSIQELAEVIQQKHQQELTVYNVRGATAVSFVKGQQATVLADSSLLISPDNYTFNIQPHLWHLGVYAPELQEWETASEGVASSLLPDGNKLYVWNGQKVLLLSETPKFEPVGEVKVDFIILKNNVRLKPEEFKRYTFNNIVLDGSSSFWYRQKLHEQLAAAGLPYYDVVDKGALVVEL